MIKEYLINSFLADELKIKKLLIIDNEVCNKNTTFKELYDYINEDNIIPFNNDLVKINGDSKILIDLIKNYYNCNKDIKIITDEDKAINMYLIDIYESFINDYNLDEHLNIEIL